ncbi:NAD(P)-dependent dehydrogenase, short-chain alcohol dehydrogenase family [Litoreibacter ascidiaceicola]|uniref:NAD(P)-dependent dehydrogenase, short-chain alcohol dehydrogenase family n=1 Tax=Litoreibacter ascidiaceicola TaxID=1486859 RepID=A0A1M4ZJ03_9RHOB|nr:SDR family NAD(P)-dependent oxidoreductase [Litoreibacter ascidiaceicola]SHF17782.1 NAD(P)-dependent dehydrogenase, short-chain alcohol dehydrogenase family [Litoreibacter ascidiaceicola]
MELKTGMSAVVTGGGSGLGEATARALAAKGLKVAIFDRNAEAGQAVASDIRGLFCNADVTDNESMVSAFEVARNAHGQERVLVSCAGIAPGAKTASKGQPHDAQLFRTALDVNLYGVFLASSLAAAGMSEADALNDDGERGVIINTASIAAFDGQVGQIAYAASKAGIVGMTLPMARDLSRSGIRVMAIAPGLFMTPMMKGLPQDVQDSLGGQTPFPQRLGDPEEFAALVCSICENVMMNGEVIRLDGAIRMGPR